MHTMESKFPANEMWVVMFRAQPISLPDSEMKAVDRSLFVQDGFSQPSQTLRVEVGADGSLGMEDMQQLQQYTARSATTHRGRSHAMLQPEMYNMIKEDAHIAEHPKTQYVV